MQCCFFLTVYDDQQLAMRCISRLQIHAPSAEIICCTDGTRNRQFQEWCHQSGIVYFNGTRLKMSRSGGRWVSRMLKSFLLLSKADVLIKIDADSLMNRAFHTIPDSDLFANIRCVADTAYLQGGCLGIRRPAVQAIVNSGLLDDPIYRMPKFSYWRYHPPYLQPHELVSDERLIGSDLIISDVSKKLGLNWAEWAEVCSYSLEGDLNQALANLTPAEVVEKYAVIHPCKS